MPTENDVPVVCPVDLLMLKFSETVGFSPEKPADIPHDEPVVLVVEDEEPTVMLVV